MDKLSERLRKVIRDARAHDNMVVAAILNEFVDEVAQLEGENEELWGFHSMMVRWWMYGEGEDKEIYNKIADLWELNNQNVDKKMKALEAGGEDEQVE